MSDVIVGRISNRITYDFRSPRTRADSRNSRLRSDSVCERSCRAPYDQPSTPSTTTRVKEAGVLLVGRDHDDEREDRQHENHVGDEGEEPVAGSAEISRRDADEDGESRGERPDGQRDHERAPGSPHELREDVLPVGRRAQQVLPGCAEIRRELLRPRVVGRDLAREDRDHDEDEHQDDADDRFAAAADRGARGRLAGVPRVRDDRRRAGPAA